MILEILPREGQLIHGVYPDAVFVSDVAKMTGGHVDTILAGTRLRVLGRFGLAASVKVPRSANRGWQITPEGEKRLKQFAAANPKPNGDSHESSEPVS
jgi:hypothetical protein